MEPLFTAACESQRRFKQRATSYVAYSQPREGKVRLLARQPECAAALLRQTQRLLAQIQGALVLT